MHNIILYISTDLFS